jgi:hypothetical protein
MYIFATCYTFFEFKGIRKHDIMTYVKMYIILMIIVLICLYKENID